MKRVLLVEYDDKTEKYASEILKKGGFQITVIADITSEYAKCYEKPADTEEEGNEVVIGDREIVIQPATRQVFVRGEEKSFPYLEFDMLYYFVTNSNTAISIRELYHNVWGRNNPDAACNDTESMKKRIRVHIKKIRDKIEKNSSEPQYITTVPKIGYCFNADKEVRRTGGKSYAL